MFFLFSIQMPDAKFHSYLRQLHFSLSFQCISCNSRYLKIAKFEKRTMLWSFNVLYKYSPHLKLYCSKRNPFNDKLLIRRGIYTNPSGACMFQGKAMAREQGQCSRYTVQFGKNIRLTCAGIDKP